MTRLNLTAKVAPGLQLAGTAAIAAGVYLLAGLAVALVLAGVLAVAYGAAHEGGWV